jgi:ribose transport system permease protein
MAIKNLGIFVLLLLIMVVTAWQQPNFLSEASLQSLVRWTSLFGLISLGVAMVIITGGIDLSIGSVVALSGCGLVILLDARTVPTDQYLAAPRVGQVETRQGLRWQLELESSQLALRPDDVFAFQDATGASVLGTVWEVTGNRVILREPGLRPYDGLQVQLLRFQHRPLWLVVGGVLLGSVLIGLIHGLLITKARLQPFVVTLCGLLIYRGLARVLSGDQPLGLGSGLESAKRWFVGNPLSIPIPLTPWVSQGSWGRYQWDMAAGGYRLDAQGERIPVDWFQWVSLPVPGLVLIVTAVVAWLLLNRTLFGRYLLALGNNPQATRFSGINNDRVVITAYVLCSAMAGLTGILLTFDLNSVEPASTGSFYELYAIAAAVIGGCSLRGGVGSIGGVVIGTAVMRALKQAIETLGIGSQWEYPIIGAALLGAVLVDELARRFGPNR